jgi:hypothetical protein
MPKPKAEITLVQPLAPEETPNELIAALRVGVIRDREAGQRLDQARAELESWLKAAKALKVPWPVMIERSGLSRGMLSRIFSNETPARSATTQDEAVAEVRGAAASFWAAKEARDQARAERNELIRRAYVGDVTVPELASLIGATSGVYVYNILHGRGSKLLKQ